MFLGRWVKQLNWIVWFQWCHVSNNKFMQRLQIIVFLDHWLFVINTVVHMNSCWLFIAYLNGCCKLEDVVSHCKRPLLICVWLFPSFSMMLDLNHLFIPCPYYVPVLPKESSFSFHSYHTTFLFQKYVYFCHKNGNITFVGPWFKTDIFLPQGVLVKLFHIWIA